MWVTSLEEVQKALARRRYWEYVKYVHQGRWIEAPYLIYTCNLVQDLLEDKLVTENGETARILCISFPPQHGKSMSITETLPSWVLGKWPHHRVIEVSYNEGFARKFGRRNKEKVNEFGENLFGVRVAKGTAAQDEWELDNGIGSMLSRGLLGSITGNPANLIIIDDPFKSGKEANSEVYRDTIWQMWLDSIRTRLAADGKVIVIMTRWHEDDLVAKMLKEESRVYYLNLPCEAEDNDPILREPGETLGAVLGKDDTWLADFKRVYLTKEGSRVWNALFQGRPTAMEGNMFKRAWFKYYDKMPEYFDEILQSWDCTFKDSDGSDFVSGTVWGRIGAEYYLLDRRKERLDLPDTCSAIMQMTAKWPRALIKLVEDKANGPAVIQLLQTRIPGLIAVNPEGGKIARANAVSPAFESGNVYFPTPEIAPWVIEYEEELCAFPNGANDDDVDSTTQALNRLIYYTNHKEPPLPPPKDAEEAMSRRMDDHLEALIKHKNKKRGGYHQV